MFANGQGSIPGWVIPKTKKMVLDVTLLNTQHYKVWIKGKIEQSREKSNPPLHLGVVANEKEASESPLTTVFNFTYHQQLKSFQLVSFLDEDYFIMISLIFCTWGDLIRY